MPSFSIAVTVGWVVMPQAILPCCSAAIMVVPAPAPMREKSFVVRWYLAAR